MAKKNEGHGLFWFMLFMSSFWFGLWQRDLAAGLFFFCLMLMIIAMLAINEAIQKEKQKQ